MKKLIPAGVIVLLLGGAGWLNMALTSPHDGKGEVVVEIRPGESARAVSRKLFREGVIKSPLLFEIETRLKRNKTRIKAGEFRLPRDISIRDVVVRLTEGGTVLHRVTIPEGLNISEIGRELERSNIVSAAEFEAAARALAVERSRAIPADSLEGYLFPETYHFRKGVPADEVVSSMVREFYSQAGAVLPDKIMNDPEALHRIVTLASLIEKETGAEGERKLIASVFLNRLEKNMLLQSDPTVIYALPDFDGNLRKKDLTYDSPFNTYLYRGLPPGPIANPGRASISAAFHPAEENYLYFVSKNNGEHYFARTLVEHNLAVRRYQIKGGRR